MAKKAVNGQKSESEDIVFFYGAECTWCHKMVPNLVKAQEQTGVRVVKREVWHDAGNAKMLLAAGGARCGGVPFMINNRTGKWLCGFSEVDDIVRLMRGG